MRRPPLIPLLVVFSLLFTSVVYACSGLAPMQMTAMSMPMDDASMQRGPCSEQKQDVCKSVRDQMLSIKAHSPAADIALDISTALHSAYAEVPLTIDPHPTAGPPGVLSHSVLKSSFPFTSQVLRI